MTFEEAVEKVRKLLALSKSYNPNEAALAAARAQEITTRYSIEAAIFEASSAGATGKEQGR